MRRMSASATLDPTAIFADFEIAARPAAIAAVSGGSDSLALLLLLEAHLEARAPATRLVAVTVDHGLRPGSPAEAAGVAALCAARGIAHRTVRWSGRKPASGLPAAAREARYDLLASAARAEGTDCVLTGHTLDDQLETVAMREARGDGRGLAGMAPATLFDGRVWLLRPLLGLARADLRAWLAARGIAWVDDPTNVDEKYERARVRAAAGDDEASRAAAPARIAAAAATRLDLGGDAARAISAHMRAVAPGLFAVDRALCDAAGPAAIYALRIVLATVGGTPHLAEASGSAALFGRIRNERFRATLSRVVVDATADAVFLHREGRGLPDGAPPVPPIWDGRFRLGEIPQGASVAPVGREARDIVNDEQRSRRAGPAGAPPRLVTDALAAEPALWRGGEFIGLATEAGLARRIIAPWARFLPSFDLAPARAAAMLIGADTPPEPPLARHNPGGG